MNLNPRRYLVFTRFRALIVGAAVLGLVGCAAPNEPEAPPATLVSIETNDLAKVSRSPLALTDAVRLGVLRSANVLTSGIELKQSGNEITIAKAAFFPELFFNIAPSSDSTRLALGSAGIRYTIYDFGERAALLGAAEAGTQKARYQILSEIDDAVLETVSNYIDQSIDHQQVHAAEDYLESVRELESAVRARVEIGVTSSIDLNDIETGLLKARSEVIDAEADEKSSKDRLASLTGVTPRSVVGVSKLRSALKTGGVKKSDLEKLSDFPKVAARAKEVEEAKFNLEATQAGIFPKIGVRLGLGVDVENGGAVSGTGIVAGPEISDSVSLGGGRKERIRNAELSVEAAIRGLREEERLTKLEFAQSLTQVAASNDRVNKRREVLDLAEKTRDIQLAEYEIGSIELRDLVDAEERIFRARAELNETLRDVLKDQLRVLKATNNLSDKLYITPK